MNHNNFKRIGITTGALGLLALGALGGRAMATGAPSLSPLTYTGVVTDKTGKPWPTAVPVSVAFYDKADAVTAKCISPTVQAEAATGRFSVVLPAECAQAVHDTPDLWAEPTVGDTKTVLPRTHVGAVPYALEADSAKTAGIASGALKASIDGLQADIAALKSAGGSGGKGGNPQVFDGAGALLGTLVHILPATDYSTPKTAMLLSPAGVLFERRLDGSPPMQGFWYSDSNCGGTPAFSVSNLTMLANVAVWEPVGKKWYLVQPTEGKTYCDGSTAYFGAKASTDGSGLCTNMGSSATKLACALTATTAAALGLPDSIAPGLSIKAP